MKPVKLIFVFGALTMAAVFGLAYYQRLVARHAVEAVIHLGGKAELSGELPNYLVSVDLAGRPITDSDIATLVPHFQAAQGPAELDLSRTRITDAGLAHFDAIDHAATLSLSGNSINGSGLVHLALLGTESTDSGAADVSLNLAGTLLDDATLRFLVPITHLASLDLSATKVTGTGLAQLRGMRYLHILTLDRSAVSDAGLAGLEGWRHLDELSVANTQISDAGVARLRKIEGLRALNLMGTKITDACIAETLAAWPKLTGLSLADTAVSNAAILRLKPSGTLTSLNLSGTGVNDATIARMAGWRNLDTLMLERTQLTEAGLLYLAQLPDLKRLYFAPSQFTNEAVARLQRARPQLSIDH